MLQEQFAQILSSDIRFGVCLLGQIFLNNSEWKQSRPSSLFEKRTNVCGFWASKLKHWGYFGCLQKMVEKLSESSEFEEFLKVVQEVAIKILSQISSIKT